MAIAMTTEQRAAGAQRGAFRSASMNLHVIPLSIEQANAIVIAWHRHHKPINGHRFSIGCVDDAGALRGACIVGRPVARNIDPFRVAEVSRLVTDGSRNACSLLYGAAARAAQAMGFDRIQTYILDDENGSSLRAAGWLLSHASGGGSWERTSKPNRRTDQPLQPKQCWMRIFRAEPISIPDDSIARMSNELFRTERREAKRIESPSALDAFIMPP